MPQAIERGLVRTSFGQIHYRTAGSGQPIILLHINQQSSALYIELINELARFSRPIAMDYPSHGMSDHIGYQPTIADYARCVTEVADGLGIKQFTVLGEATGSGVSIELAGQYPDRIAKAVLVNCPYHPEPVRSEDLLAPFKINRPEDETGFPLTRTIPFMLSREARQVPMHPTQEWMDRINTAMIEAGRDRWHALTALSHYDVGAGLKRIRCPTLFLTGEFFYYAAQHAEAMALVPGAKGHILQDARFCAGWEAAREIAAYVRAFIA